MKKLKFVLWCVLMAIAFIALTVVFVHSIICLVDDMHMIDDASFWTYVNGLVPIVFAAGSVAGIWYLITLNIYRFIINKQDELD